MAEIEIVIDLTTEGLPSLGEVSLRHQFADLIEHRGIGHVTGSGGGLGKMDIDVEVSDEPTISISKLRDLADELGISDVTTIEQYESGR